MVYITLFFLLITFLVFLSLLPRKEVLVYQKTESTAVICAHNEARVIGNIISDCNAAGFNEIIIIADSCTDATEAIAQAEGCRIIKVACHSKTLALREAFPAITYGKANTALIFFFDADNRFAPDFLTKAIPYFYKSNVVQFHLRNANYKTWVSRMYLIMMGYFAAFEGALAFMHATAILGGTGWGARALTLKQNPFTCSTLIDDLEYSCRLKEKIGYGKGVDVFDEKPDTFSFSYRQRMRWMRGGYQLFFTNWRAYDYRKIFMMAFPVFNLYASIMFLTQLSTGNPLTTILYFLIEVSLFNCLYYGFLLDHQDLSHLKIQDFFLFTIFCMSNYLIVFWSLLTWKNKKWYATPHTGINNG